MFATTKLRRGMISKGYERGMLNIESWGKSHVSPLSFAHHHLSFLLLVGIVICWQKYHSYTHADTRSPRRAFWVADGLPTREIASLSIFHHTEQN